MKPAKSRAADLVRAWVHSEDSSMLGLMEALAEEFRSVEDEARRDGVARAIAWCGITSEPIEAEDVRPSEVRRCIEETENRRYGHRITDEMLAGLSARQREVCALIHAGKTPAEAAQLLGISKSTARNHVYNAALKLGCRNAEEMVSTMKRSEKLF